MKGRRRGLWYPFAALLLVAVTAICLSGCKTTKYIPVETVRTEYKEADTTAIYNRLLQIFESRREKESRSDSLVDREKETVVLKENGDTARHDRERIVYVSSKYERDLEHKVKQQDSLINILMTRLLHVKADSIPVPYPVEKSLTKWQQIKVDFGGLAICALLGMLCGLIVSLVRSFKR